MNSQKLNLKIYMIAGEDSGDLIGSGLMKELKKISNQPIRFLGIGGIKMKEEGLEEIFEMSKLSIMGIFEVLGSIFKFLNLIKITKNSIFSSKPDILITIDSPGFNLRIQKATSSMKNLKRIHYVAPSVWAWKSYRAKEMSRFLDLLLVLFPFEKKYFSSEGLDTKFVGHAVLYDIIKNNKLNKNLNIKQLDLNNLKIVLLPGSRKNEIKKILPVLIKVSEELSVHFKNIKFFIVTQKLHKEYIETKLSSSNISYNLTDDSNKKYEIYSKVDLALCASGTVSLELACLSTPMIVVYKMNWVTYLIVKSMVKINTVSIVNIILEKNIIPEYLQYNASVKNLVNASKNLILNRNLRDEQIKGFKIALEDVINIAENPSYLAARAILKNKDK